MPKDTKPEGWVEEFDKKFVRASQFCGCYEGDMDDQWPLAKRELKAFIAEVITAERERIHNKVNEIGNRRSRGEIDDLHAMIELENLFLTDNP